MIEDILSGLVSQALWVLLGLAISASIYVFLKLRPTQKRKENLFRFFGVNAANPILAVYLSSFQIIQPFRINAVPEEELGTLSFMGELLYDPINEFPKPLRNWLNKRNRFKSLQLLLAASPVQEIPYTGFKFTSLIAVGGPTFNTVSRYYERYHPNYLRLNILSDQVYEFEVIKGSRKGEKLPIKYEQRGSAAILEKTIDDEHGTVAFIAGGTGIAGTIGAIQYLMKHWQKLYSQYGDRPFSIALFFDVSRTASLDDLQLEKLIMFPEGKL